MRRGRKGERWFIMSAIPVTTPGFRGLGVMHENITPQKLNEASLHAMLEATPDAMLILNSGGRIVWVNAQTERLFGYPREALVGQPVELLVPERFDDSSAPDSRLGATTAALADPTDEDHAL